MSVTVDGIVTLSMFMQAEKARSPMPVIIYPSIVEGTATSVCVPIYFVTVAVVPSSLTEYS